MSNKNNICNLNAERNTMTVAEAARYVGVSKDLIYKMVREGESRLFELGKEEYCLEKTQSTNGCVVKKYPMTLEMRSGRGEYS